MNKKNPKVDDYLSKAQKWQGEIKKLRKILLDCPLTEELKWGKPCYTFQKSNLIIIIALKECCALMFCKGVLLKDASGILVKPGENSQSGRWIEFTSAREITELESVVKAYVQEAIEAERAGLKVKYKKPGEFVIPEELQNKFVEDPALKAAFKALTPGRQRGYILYFSAPKQSKTRDSRIEKCRQRILDGRGLNDYDKGVRSAATERKSPATAAKPVLLTGGNPQIAKADGDAPVQAYIAAMPGWKNGLGRRLDALVERTVPGVRKAVKWNTPLYGVEGQGWFLGYNCCTKYVRITFFRGTSLRPIPPVESKTPEARYFHIFESEQDQLDEKLLASWIKQASKVPGWSGS